MVSVRRGIEGLLPNPNPSRQRREKVDKKENFYESISDALVDLDEEQVLTLTQRGLEQGLVFADY
jgi:hypothetical protein